MRLVSVVMDGAWNTKATGLCSSWIQCSVDCSKSEQRWWSGSCSHVLAAWRQKLLSLRCPGLPAFTCEWFQVSVLSSTTSCAFLLPRHWNQFMVFCPKHYYKKKKKISMKEAAGKYIPVHQSAVKVVVVEGPFWKNLMVRKGVLNLMIKCSTAVLCHCSKNTADAQNISGNCFKMVEFAEMKGGETDTKLSVSCTCLVYLFALLTINCFPNLC